MNDAVTDDRPNWLAAARVYLDGRVIAILFLGFSSGMPLLLTFSTLSIWLAEEGISKTSIGLFALLATPYSLKFLWAPFIDRLRLPILTPWLGRRRGWAILTQLALVVGIVGLGGGDPVRDTWTMATWAVFVAFASASQDVVIDAYRVEILEERQYGAGSAMIVAGYRIGMLASGAGAPSSSLHDATKVFVFSSTLEKVPTTMSSTRPPDIGCLSNAHALPIRSRTALSVTPWAATQCSTFERVSVAFGAVITLLAAWRESAKPITATTAASATGKRRIITNPSNWFLPQDRRTKRLPTSSGYGPN